jgi:RNA polymerase sigma factor (TIGR02999 family)
MRRILVDHARAGARQKRGGDAVRVTLDEGLAAASGTGANEALLALDEALERLAAIDRRKAEAVELHYFGGLSYDETAAALGVSAATVDRELRMAKAWLARELSGG